MAEKTIRDRLHETVDAAASLLYPITCPSCDVPLPSSRVQLPICDDCGVGMSRIAPPYCRVCGQAYEGAMSADFQCSNCADRKLAFDFAIGGYAAEGLLRQLMHRFKYEQNIYLAQLLGRLLESTLTDKRIVGKDWILVPVPLHRRRFRNRGFNQAVELCRVLKKRNPKRFQVKKAIRRVRHTPRQAGLDREQRLSNLRGAFALSRFGNMAETLVGKRILLVDDVLTTGATASECGRVLRNSADIAEIGVITVLRG